MKYFLLFTFYFLLAAGCGIFRKAPPVVDVPVAVPIDTAVAVVFPETVYEDSSDFWAWPEAQPFNHSTIQPSNTWTWDWPEATTTVTIHPPAPPQGGTTAPGKIYVKTKCKERIDTVRIRDTLLIDASCPERPTQTTEHGQGWWLAAALAFVWIMTFFAERKKKKG